MQGSALIEGTHTGTMIKIPLMAIKGMANQIERSAGNQGRGQPFKKDRMYYMYLTSERTWCPSRQWKTKATRWLSLMTRYVYGKIMLNMPSLLCFELIHYIRSVEVR